MSSSIVSPFPVFNDLDGTPLENGYIYIGASNLNPETSPVNVYWDAARTIPAPQPIRTIGGFPSRNGSPSNVYVEADTYSITVRNSRRAFVYSAFNQSDAPTAVFNVAQQVITATAQQTTFTLTTFTYLPGTDTLEVYRNGLHLTVNVDYVETNSSTVTLTTPAALGDELMFRGGTVITGNQTPGTNVSFLQAGTGAVTRNMQDKARESVSVKDFGAVGDGVTDDTAAIQAAVNAAQTANGTTVLMPQGTYKISTSISIVSPVSIIGMAGATIIAPNFATGSAFQIVPPSGWPYDSGVTIANLNFKASVARTSGAYLSSNNGYYITVTRCQFLNGYNGIHLTGPAATGFYVKDCIFANNTNDNILIDAATGLQGPVDVVLQDLWIHGASQTSQSVSGVYIKAAGDITLRHVSTVWSGSALRVQPSSGNRIQALVCNECFFDSGNGYGVYIDTSAGGVVDLIKIANTWIATNGQGGVALTGSALIKHVDLIDCVISNNNGNGVLLNNTSVRNTSIIGCSISSNTGNGIYAGAGVVNFKVVGCTIGQSGEFTGNSQWGIYIASGGSDYYIIANNKITDNTAGQLFDSGTGINKTVYPNIGAGTAITTNSVQSVDWGIDFAKQGAILITSGTPYQLGVGSGLVLLHHNAGGLAMFLAYAGGVTKVSGAANIVAGAAALNQIGLAYNSGTGKYEVSCGYPTPQDVYISTLKTRLAS
jgi:hypothetical protein